MPPPADATVDQPVPPPQTPDLPRRRRFASARAVLALMLREMSTSNGRSPGGYIWAILEPVAGIALLSLVFSAFVRAPAIGISFPMFYATGMIPFVLFMDIHTKIASALTYSRQLLVYPSVTYLDAMMARFLMNAITQIMIAYLVFTSIILLFDTRVTLNLPVIVEAVALAMFFAVSMGTLNCYLFTRFPLAHRIWQIITRPLFLISGIFFLLETLPAEYQGMLWYNPLVHIIGLTRMGFYGTYRPDYVSVEYVVGVSLVMLAMGLLLLRRNYRDLLTR